MTLRALASVALLAALLRFGVLALVFPPTLTGDELYYADTALHIARGEGHYSKMYQASANWPPAQAFALSMLVGADSEESYRDLGPGILARMLSLEAALASLTALLIAVLAWQLFDARTGFVAGMAAAVYPTFIAYSHYLWSETLFLFLEVAGLAVAVKATRSGRAGWVVASGLLFGAAALTRETGLLVAGSVALWWLAAGMPCDPGSDEKTTLRAARSRRSAAAFAALLLVCAGLVIAPWTARNYQRFDRLVPVSTVGWMGVREGNTFTEKSWLRPDLTVLRAFRARYFSIPDEMARVEMARGEALALIRQEQPSWLAKKLVRNTALFFAPDSFLFKKISRQSYGPPRMWLLRGVLVLAVSAYLTVMLGAILGLALATPRQRLLALLCSAAVFGLHLLALASSRYRLALMPLALVFAAHAWLARERIPELSPRTRGWLVAAGIIVVLWPCAYFAPDAAALWSHGHYAHTLRP